MYPRLLNDHEACRTWFTLFCQHEIIFHAFHYAEFVHRTLIQGEANPHRQTRALAHKGETIRLLISIINGHVDFDLDVVLLVMLLLATNEMPPEAPETWASFQAHWPTANWLNVYGRLRPHDSHLEAMYKLIVHAGGLYAVKLAPLASTIALYVVQPKMSPFSVTPDI